ncbi:MarR family winged helix-turn-helix transcriptional regulator [Nocardia cerradoensis]|nr:MarR family transcriptional regulator [Nocardia cerradoensis]NKY43627.1 winged helix DNA-binding protein [Nocardia cerradoensis]
MNEGRQARHGYNPVVRFMHLLAAGHRSPLQAQQLKTITGYPITLQDEAALRLICDVEPLTISEVAFRLDVNLPRASRQLSKLESLGLAERLPCHDDGRSSRMRATAEGERIHTAWRRTWVRDYVEAIAWWEPADITRFGDILTRLHAAFEKPEPALHRLDRQAIDLSRWTGDDSRWEALHYTVPILVKFVHWAVTSVVGPANTRAALAAAGSPIAAQPAAVLRIALRYGPLDVTDVAHRTGLATSRTSRIVGDLTKYELVERATDSLDGRRIRIKATSRGSSLIRRIDAHQFGPIVTALNEWDRRDIDACMSYFERMLEHFTATPPNRTGRPTPQPESTPAG